LKAFSDIITAEQVEVWIELRVEVEEQEESKSNETCECNFHTRELSLEVIFAIDEETRINFWKFSENRFFLFNIFFLALMRL
jgi:hypothetical protein